MRAMTFLFLIATACFSAAPTGLLPADNAVSDWTDDVSTNCVQGSATDSATLYAKIDGDATQFMTRGYQGSAYNGYKNATANKMCVEIYDQGTPTGALALSQYFYGTGEECRVITGLGDSARLDTSPAFNNNLEFTTGRYFVRIIVKDSKSESMNSAAVAMGQAIVASAIAVEKSPAGLRLSPALRVYPAPAASGLVIEAGLKGEMALCRIYNGAGQCVREWQGLSPVSGRVRLLWDGCDKSGRTLASGHYVAEIRTPRETVRGRITLAR